MTSKLFGALKALAIVLCGLAMTAAPARSVENPLDLLMSYVGDWRGESVLVGGANPEAFRCRLTITRGTQTKINYAGRCTLVRMNLAVAGTIAFNVNTQRYEAAMSSNVGFTGMAVGRAQGDRIHFDLVEQQTDRGGNDVRIGAGILLVGGAITVEFEVEFNQSGEVLTSSVPFSR